MSSDMTNCVSKSTNYGLNHPSGWFFVIIVMLIYCSEVKPVFFKKKKVKFHKVAKFNYELDTNEELKEELKKLSLCRNDMARSEYLSKILLLFSKEGLDLTLKEFDMLLLLRAKTDQMLLEKTGNAITQKSN